MCRNAVRMFPFCCPDNSETLSGYGRNHCPDVTEICKLVNAAMNALGKEGIKKVTLVVFSKNEKGNAFWEKQGFIKRDDLNYRNKAIEQVK